MYDSGGIRWYSARTMAKARCPLNLSTAVHAPCCYEAHNLLYFGCLRSMDIDLGQRRREQLLG